MFLHVSALLRVILIQRNWIAVGLVLPMPFSPSCFSGKVPFIFQDTI